MFFKKWAVVLGLGGIFLLAGCIALFNQPPRAEFSWTPLQPYAKQEVRFDASASYDPDGEITRYLWNFGDGNTGEGKIVTHTFADNGTFTVTLTVYDNFGKTDFISKVVKVLNPPPEITSITISGRPVIGESILFVVSAYDPASHQSPELQPLRIVSYRWDFGDGTVSVTEAPTVTHIYSCAGRYRVTVTATDDDGATSSASTSVTIYGINRPPIACFTWEITGTVVRADAWCSVDNDLICLDGKTYTHRIVSYRWELYFENQLVAVVGEGPNRVFSYDMNGFHGNWLLRLTVRDDEGSFSSYQVAFFW